MTYVLDYGFVVLTTRVNAEDLVVSEERVRGADVTMSFRGSVKPLLAGEITPAEAMRAGLLVVHGNLRALDRFIRLFAIPAAPEPEPALVAS